MSSSSFSSFSAAPVPAAWSACQVENLGRGRYRLVGVPPELTKRACCRLLQLGVTRARVIEPGVVGFQCAASSPVLFRLFSVFPPAMAA